MDNILLRVLGYALVTAGSLLGALCLLGFRRDSGDNTEARHWYAAASVVAIIAVALYAAGVLLTS